MKTNDDTEIVMTAEAVRAMGIDRVPRAKDDEAMSKAEKLAVAGVVAPVLRSMPESVRKRRIYVTRKEDGAFVRYGTLDEVPKAVLAQRAIELATNDETRPKVALCDRCGKDFKPAPVGMVQRLCGACRDPNCQDCGAVLPKRGFTNKGQIIRCSDCSYKSRTLPPIMCSGCGVEMPKTTRSPSRETRRAGKPPLCSKCAGITKRAEPIQCSICGAKLGRSAMSQRAISARRGAPPKCRSCNLKVANPNRKRPEKEARFADGPTAPTPAAPPTRPSSKPAPAPPTQT